MDNEIWKDVIGYKGFYQVSNLGRIRSLDRTVERGCSYLPIKGKVLTGHINGDGYHFIGLCKNNIRKFLAIHRIVAQAFIKNKYDKPCIDHIDGNRLNNNVENLQWCTNKENMNNPISIKRMSKSLKGRSFSKTHKEKIGLANRNRTDQSKNVAKIDKTSGKTIKVYPSLGEAYRQTGIHFSNISKVCKKKTKSAGGFKWEFIN